MALDYTNGRLGYLHTIPSVNAKVITERLGYLHTIPSANGSWVNTRLNYLHTIPSADGSWVNTRLNYLHTVPPPSVVFGSPADAVAGLPNSGAVSPFKSNRDAARALK